MGEWFDDDAFWVELYPYLFPRDRMESAVEEVESLLALVPYQGGSVLDLCCGPGRHAIALAQRGLSVTGVDRTAFLLEEARQRAKIARVEVEWVLSDMREFVRPGTFDLALNMFTSFGYFSDESHNLEVLANLRASLESGGTLVMEMAGKEYIAAEFQPTISEQSPDGSLLVRRQEIVDDWTRVRNEWTVVKEGTAKTFRFQNFLYSGQELKERLERAGFTKVRLYGDLDGAAYGRESRRLVAVAIKD